jgi:hypothetical protein
MRHPEAKIVVDGIGDFKDIVVQQDTLNELAINLTAGIYFLNSTVDSVSPEMHLD